uniref:acid phosphatase n=1 Tax=Panagrolaimus davidi TaxID=227884 RepID=A0A914QQU6_9BILA
MLFLLILLLISLNLNFNESRELRFVQAIWRHGDRSPTKLPYPNDIYDESYWQRGWSQLTDLGVEQLEELGTFFNDRYVGKFVNSSYKPDEVSLIF